MIPSIVKGIETRVNKPEPPIALGAYISGAPQDSSRIDQFTTMVGTRPRIVMWYQDWAHDRFIPAEMDAVVAHGAMPMVTWEPWDHSAGSKQPMYSLSVILSGQYDAYIHQWAKDAAAWGKPFYLRPAHEMNGSWYPWGTGTGNPNGNTAAQYVQFWHHLRAIFKEEGATKIIWVWSPNVAFFRGTSPFVDSYPGDALVDWVALDGYNGGSALPWGGWLSLRQIFTASYQRLATMTMKPMMIAETASTEAGGDKAQWITQGFLTDIPSYLPRVRAVIWFDENKETDWRVNSSSSSTAAYVRVAGSAIYQGRLP